MLRICLIDLEKWFLKILVEKNIRSKIFEIFNMKVVNWIGNWIKLREVEKY